ncbi:MATE family efflux transporter [Bifidobacterium sp. ESL0745]|uniref:MATE family efflux transporter n=1 Tax=Bifidobacterium sp. ESL0745 TaxID=2983226 RepID=UPI0023F8DAEB|nr:MATE family efflux transporter [Bifidobacterium sp. ESL0745]MDF7665589.1 MATE family efflux transporter [Bifidobacterium sp. ESL0745]
MKDKHMLAINMVASLIQFAINLGIGFCLTPFIVNKLGAEAYGYVGLANNVINYASLLTVALDSVAGRFITVAYHQGDKKRADRYFSSTLAADCLIAVILILVALPLIADLDKIINISPHLINDVKLLFLFIFIQFVITSVSTVLTVATFITNKLYLSSIANALFSIVRVLVMLICFGFFPPFVAYVSFAAVLGTIVSVILNYFYTQKLTPELKFHKTMVSWKTVKEMLASGIWNVIIKLQQVISFGLKLLVANLAISPYKMGMMSIAQTVPNMILTLFGSVSSLFYPNQTQYYAQGKKKELIAELRLGMKTCGFFAVPIIVTSLIVGKDFFVLWQPHQDTRMLYSLMLITLSGFLVSGAASTLQNVPLIVNRLKLYSIVWLLFSLLSLPVTLLLLKITNLDIYAVALVPTVIEIIANIFFVPMYAARELEVNVLTFYSIYFQYVIALLVSVFVVYSFKFFFRISVTNWISLILACIFYACVALAITLLMLLNKSERLRLFKKISMKIRSNNVR